MPSHQLRFVKQILRSTKRAVSAKVAFSISGRSPVAGTCQIPELREKYHALRLPRKGIFVEIGGYDGESWSNTSFLADEGWHGIYVEPIPALSKLIRLRHFLNHVRVENAAISDSEGTVRINFMGPLTTLNEATAAAYKDIPWALAAFGLSKSIEVRTTSLEKVLGKNAVPFDFDLMVIDVEGNEEPIVDSLLATRWKPHVLIVELCDLHPDFAAFPELQASAKRVRQAIISGGYKQFYADEINSIFDRY